MVFAHTHTHTHTYTHTHTRTLTLINTCSHIHPHSQPAQPVTVQGLGRTTITLVVEIENMGPTTIRDGSVTINLANRIMDTNYTLYPSRIEVCTAATYMYYAVIIIVVHT